MANDKSEKLNYVSSSSKVIYLIEIEKQIIKRVKAHLEKEFPGHEVICLDNYAIALKKIIHQKPQVIISNMETPDGENCFDSLIDPLLQNELTKNIPIVITAVRSDLNREKDKIKQYHIDLVPKPFRLPLLINTVDEAMKSSNSIDVRPLTLEANDVLFREGEPGESIYFLKSGELDVYKEVERKFVHLAKISNQQLVGEMAFLDDGARSASIVAKTKCELLQLNLDDIKRFISEQPFWLGMIIDTLAMRVKETNKKLTQG